MSKTPITPFFLVGAERSGTTLLRLILDHHPELACTWESEYIVDYWPSEQVPATSAVAASIASDRIYREHVDAYGVQLPQSCDNLCMDFEYLLNVIRRKAGKRLIGATVHRHVDRLLRLWPSARYIRLIRDGRDVANSRVAMGWEGNAWSAAKVWVKEEQDWDICKSSLEQSQYIEVRFEQLVANPEAELTRICEFLGVDYSPQMLSFPSDTSYSAIDTSLAHQWKDRMPKRDLGWVQSVQADILQRRGYTLGQVDSRAPGSVTQIFLRMQSRLAVAHFRLRKFGLPLWLRDQWIRRTGLASSRWRSATAEAMEEVVRRHLK